MDIIAEIIKEGKVIDDCLFVEQKEIEKILKEHGFKNACVIPQKSETDILNNEMAALQKEYPLNL